MSANIELSKTRDFGEIISDSFLFVRENFKPLLKCFFIFCGFFLAATIVVSYLQQTKMMSILNTVDTNSDSYSVESRPFSAFSRFFGVEYFLAILFQILNLTMIVVTVLSYMAVYKTKGNQPPTAEEVWAYIKYYFLKSLGSLFLVIILLAIATICCIIPGIWLYPILSLIFPIMIIENASFGYAFNQSFRLIKDNWWATFGALFVISLIVSVLITVIVLPVGAVNMGSMLLRHSKTPQLNPTLLFISTVLTAICHVFYILPLVTLALCYFNLTELKDATGLMDRIIQLGNNKPDDTHLPTEEF